VVDEAKTLAKNGVKEIILVAQDTTKYGSDIYGKSMLPTLMKEIAKIDGIEWIRTLYTYPDKITDELIEAVANEDKLCKYFDIPIQHCNKEILSRMNRNGDKESLLALVKKLRSKIPQVTLRTTLITGFPGETEEQFEELCEFVAKAKFDRLGCFAYSPEEDTPAASFPDQIDEQTKADRAEIIMNDQLRTVIENNEAKIGSVRTVLVEGYDDYIKCYFGRSEADAPEIDGKVFFLAHEPLVIGEFVSVQINDTIEYDLLGEVAEDEYSE
jgi:ribosomal protein S12 methylthiotransferase